MKCHHPRKAHKALHTSGGLQCLCAEGYRATDTRKYPASTSTRKKLKLMWYREFSCRGEPFIRERNLRGNFHNKTYCYNVDRGWANEYTFLGGGRWYNPIRCPCAGVQNSAWQTQHLQYYTFACAGGSELCSTFLSTGGSSLSDPSGVKQQRISLLWLFGSGEVVHLWHSCTDRVQIPKRSIQCRCKLRATWAVPPSHWQLLLSAVHLFHCISKICTAAIYPC